VADHRVDVLVRDDVLRVRHAHVGLRLVVEGNELDLVARLLERALQLVDGELRAELDAFAQGGLPTGERALRGDLDRAFALRVARHRHRDQRNGDRQQECSENAE
jgi:hypothetical protein